MIANSRARRLLVDRWRRRGRDSGYVAVVTALLFSSIFLPLSAVSVDVARLYLEGSRVQRAADAAALAGVTYLPSNVPSAQARAVAVATEDGYPNSGTSTVTAVQGPTSTQLTVTITSKVTNTFGSTFGVRTATVSRTAVADYHAPAPLGSPCNTFGNELPGATDDAVRGPRASQLVTPAGGAVCSTNPQFWGAVAGPDTGKKSGDAYSTRTCTAGNSNCTSSLVNLDFRPNGYFYSVHVAAAAVGTQLNLQIFDPALVNNNDNCDQGPLASDGNPFRNNMSPYVPNDGITRYAPTNSSTYCTGDVLKSANVTTSFVLRSPVASLQPLQAAAIPACEHQYGSYPASAATSNALDSTNAAYNPEVAKVYRQWVTQCSFTPTAPGDYYLQVRTDVAPGGVSDGQGGMTGNSAVWTQTTDDPNVKGDGNNRWALRITGAQRAATSISGYDALGLYINYTGANTSFNLVKVIPATAQQYLDIGFFDVGDGASSGSPGVITIQPPSDSNFAGAPPGCVGTGVFNGPMTNCALTNVYSNYDGQWQYVRVPIPKTYTCNSTQTGGCWFRVGFSFPGSVPQDTTTWTASIDGDPVMLTN